MNVNVSGSKIFCRMIDIYLQIETDIFVRHSSFRKPLNNFFR